jgi:hypothetical protein
MMWLLLARPTPWHDGAILRHCARMTMRLPLVAANLGGATLLEVRSPSPPWLVQLHGAPLGHSGYQELVKILGSEDNGRWTSRCPWILTHDAARRFSWLPWHSRVVQLCIYVALVDFWWACS